MRRTLHEEETAFLGQIYENFRFFRIQSSGLLEQNAFAGLKSGFCCLEMLGMRHANVDDVYLGVIIYVLIGS